MRVKIIDEVEFCCKKMKEYYDTHNIQFNSGDCKMSFGDRMIDECPFCEKLIEIDVSVSHRGGE